MSINLMDLMQGQLSDGLLDQLSNQIGGADKQQTATAASGIMTTLMGALAKNASTPNGANALSNALDRDHDGSVLDDLMGIMSGQKQTANPKTLNGTGILNHLLGNKQNNATQMISQMSGLDSGKTNNLMTMLAPIVMASLGKAKKSNGLDAAGIANLLSGNVSNQKSSNPTMSLVTKFLDSDGDGSIADDVANMGMKFLGGLFKKRK